MTSLSLSKEDGWVISLKVKILTDVKITKRQKSMVIFHSGLLP